MGRLKANLRVGNETFLTRIVRTLGDAGVDDVVIVVGSAVLHILNGTVRVRPSWTGKVATVLQMAAIAWVMLKMHNIPLIYLVGAAGFFTFVSGVIYVRDGVRQLSAEGHANAKTG